ncbi:hypothetical protein, conserved [Eimeria praecox]|uniref:Transmembrane protein n=1 Tax=Eimeria praecox TaxID=51316 RepID=U6H307_9EIME|nr:hypothetical protein, conserved [Eimeria praecox]
MLGSRQCFVYSVFAAEIVLLLASLQAEGLREKGGIETFKYSLQQEDFPSLGKQWPPRESVNSLSVTASREKPGVPFAQRNLELVDSSSDTGVFGESLSAASAQAFSIPFAQGPQKEALKLQGTALHPELAAVLTPARYSASLQRGIIARLRSNPGVTPIIRARWHTAEQYVAAASALRDDRAPVKTQMPSQFFREKGFALVPATQESLTDEKGNPLPYPFSLPTPFQLLQSAFGNGYAVKELATDQFHSTEPSLGDPSSGRGSSALAGAESSSHSPRFEANQTREATSAFLRWIPFGLTRISSAAEVVGELPAHGQAGKVTLFEPPESEELFVKALSRALPRRWLKAPDGRRLVIVLNDQITECRSLLHLAVNSLGGGTPVFVENSEGLDPRKLLMRLSDERIDGKRIAFLLFALGESEILPMNAAFLDRAVLRVPKADDIKSFLKRKEEEAAEELVFEKEELEEMRQHMERRKEHLLELDGGEKAAKMDEASITLQQKDSESSGQLGDYIQKSVKQAPVLVLNPFNEYLLRFNYTEVSDLTNYAEALATELRNEPLEISIGGESHRVAVMILSEPPETETELGSAWVRLNRLIHVAIAISVIVGLLCCLCMWRLMLLLKQR